MYKLSNRKKNKFFKLLQFDRYNFIKDFLYSYF